MLKKLTGLLPRSARTQRAHRPVGQPRIRRLLPITTEYHPSYQQNLREDIRFHIRPGLSETDLALLRNLGVQPPSLNPRLVRKTIRNKGLPEEFRLRDEEKHLKEELHLLETAEEVVRIIMGRYGLRGETTMIDPYIRGELPDSKALTPKKMADWLTQKQTALKLDPVEISETAQLAAMLVCKAFDFGEEFYLKMNLIMAIAEHIPDARAIKFSRRTAQIMQHIVEPFSHVWESDSVGDGEEETDPMIEGPKP
jgi:hypothetical protein